MPRHGVGVAGDHTGGNQALRNAGATFTGGNATVVGGVDVGAAIVAHEAALLRMANAGDIFRLDRYPNIDLANGGSIHGVLDSLNSFIDLAVSDTLAEGGTRVIPGHGRICDEADLVRYRDMVTIIRDRIAALKERGQTLAQIKAAKPTLDYDSRFGASPDSSGEDFIEAVYASLGT